MSVSLIFHSKFWRMNREVPLDVVIQQLQGMSGEDRPLSLQEDLDTVQVHNRLNLVGKIISERVLNVKAVKAVLHKFWSTSTDFRIEEAGQNLFVSRLGHKLDMRKIRNMGPWSVMGHHLLLVEWPPDLTLEELNLELLWCNARWCSSRSVSWSSKTLFALVQDGKAFS